MNRDSCGFVDIDSVWWGRTGEQRQVWFCRQQLKGEGGGAGTETDVVLLTLISFGGGGV